MRWILGHVTGGVIRWAVGAFIGAVCLVLSFAPQQWIAENLFLSPPDWLVHPLARVVVIIIGLAMIAAIALWKPNRSRRSAGSADRIPLTKFRELAVNAGWNSDLNTTTDDNNFWTFKARLVQAAVDERIKFWGRKYKYDIPEDIGASVPLTRISPNHFSDHEFDVFELAKAKNYDIFTSKTATRHAEQRGQIYRDPHLTQAKAWLKDEGNPNGKR